MAGRRFSVRGARAAVALAGLVVSACRESPERAPGPPAPPTIPSATPAAEPKKHIDHRATFAVSAVRVTIEDMAMSTKLDELLASASAELVVNGGFFDADGGALGLAISEGKASSSFSPTMSGGVLWIHQGAAHLSATEEYTPGPADFAIQCRPRLVVSGGVNIRSDDGLRAARTAVCLRGAGQTIEFVAALPRGDSEGPTLRELASELVELGCEQALNLDGGPSTGWASRVDGGVTAINPRAPVRHAVVVRRR